MRMILNNEIEIPIINFSDSDTIISGTVSKIITAKTYYDNEINIILENIQEGTMITSLKVFNELNKLVYENKNLIYLSTKERGLSPVGDYLYLRFKETTQNNE